MYDDLNDLLLNYVSPENAAVYLDAYRALSELGMEGQDTELLNIMGIPNDQIDSAQLMGAVEACLVVATGSALNQYGVIMIDGTPLTVMSQTAEALGTFDRYCFERPLLAMFDDPDYDNITIIAELVAACSALEVIDVETYVAEVRDSTMTRLKTILTETLETTNEYDSEEPDSTVPQRLIIINDLIKSVPERTLLVKQIAEKGYLPNVRFDTLLEEVIDQLDMLAEPRDIAFELLALTVYSTWNWESFIVEIVRDYIDSPGMERLVLNHISEYTREKGYGDVKA